MSGGAGSGSSLQGFLIQLTSWRPCRAHRCWWPHQQRSRPCCGAGRQGGKGRGWRQHRRSRQRRQSLQSALALLGSCCGLTRRCTWRHHRCTSRCRGEGSGEAVGAGGRSSAGSAGMVGTARRPPVLGLAGGAAASGGVGAAGVAAGAGRLGKQAHACMSARSREPGQCRMKPAACTASRPIPGPHLVALELAVGAVGRAGSAAGRDAAEGQRQGRAARGGTATRQVAAAAAARSPGPALTRRRPSRRSPGRSWSPWRRRHRKP